MSDSYKPDYSRIDLYSSQIFQEEILFQGKLSKFQAGFKNSFNQRWIVVTKSALRYYKSQEASLTHTSKPLFTVPMLALESVSRVNFSLGLNKEQTITNADFLVN